MKVVAQNKKAHYDYAIEERFEAGVSLTGTEVKAIREGRINLRDSYVLVRDNEAFLFNCHISPYSHGNIMNHEPLRTRKLLLHKKEISKLTGKSVQKGYTLIPTLVYFKGPYVKVEVGLGKGKKQYEKRDSIKEREAKREIERAMKN